MEENQTTNPVANSLANLKRSKANEATVFSTAKSTMTEGLETISEVSKTAKTIARGIRKTAESFVFLTDEMILNQKLDCIADLISRGLTEATAIEMLRDQRAS